MTDRSSRAEVRNWLKTLDEIFVFIDALSPTQRKALKAALLAFSRRARKRSNELWIQNKAPMAAYWRAKSVYARHFSAVMKP